MHSEFNNIESLLGVVAEPDAVYGTIKKNMPFEAHIKAFSTPITSSIPVFSEFENKFILQVEQYTAISDYQKRFDDIIEQCAGYSTIYTKLSDNLKNIASLGKISLADLGISNSLERKPYRNSLKTSHQLKASITQNPSPHINEKSTSGTETTVISSSAVTDSTDINRRNKEYKNSLDAITPEFLVMLRREDFEDGIENDSIKTVRGFLKQNEAVTYLWMHSLFTRNEYDQRVVSGLLRIISMTVKDEDQDSLMPIILAALRSENSYEQEAAVMVIEEWRTPSCRDALGVSLEKNQFHTEMMRNYAEMVYSELLEEIDRESKEL